MLFARARTSSSSQHSLEESGPPTPPKDVFTPRDSSSSTSELSTPVPVVLDASHNQDSEMNKAASQDLPAPSEMSLNPIAGQTETSITHQSIAGNSNRDKDKDKGSWTSREKNTGSWTLTIPVRRRSRRKSGIAASNGKGHAPGADNSPSTPTGSSEETQSKRRKISFLQRITFICTCCVSPRTHDIDVDEEASRHSEQKDPEKQADKDTADPPGPVPHAQEPSSSSTIVVPSPQTLTVASSSAPPSRATSPLSDVSDADIAIVVPPTPSKQLLPLSETDGLTSGAVQPPGSTGDEIKTEVRVVVGESDDSDGSFDDEPFVDGRQIEDWEDDEQRLIREGGAGIPVGPDGKLQPLLPALDPKYAGRKCLVLDLDETLVHSSLRPVPAPDYVVPVEIENNWHNFYVLKRPGVDNFLRKMGELYEVVVFTASLSKYADPVLDRLDPGSQSVAHRLFRESCYNHRGNYVKDLSQLGRPVGDTIILDNSPASYIFHPHNAVPVSSWFNDPHDTELSDLCPFLKDLSTADDVRGVLNPFVDLS